MYYQNAVLIFLTSFQLLAQIDLNSLEGKFITCEANSIWGIHDERVRKHRFECPLAQGYVLDDTPIKKITVDVFWEDNPEGMNHKKINLETTPQCNTISCIADQKNLLSLIKTNNPQFFDDNYSFNQAIVVLKTAELFEYYPIFKSPGPSMNEFLNDETFINTENDQDYISRINGSFPKSDQELINPSTILLNIESNNDQIKKEIVSNEKIKEICEISSLTTLEKDQQEIFLKLILKIYQNPNFKDENLQRKLFCLLKNYYEKLELFDELMELILKMSFEVEMCSG